MCVLLSSAGRRVELMSCFRKDAAELGLELTVIATDLDPSMSAACHTADRAHRVPRCTSPEFVPHMLALCVREGVDLLVPTIDTELLALAAARDELGRGGTQVVVSSPEIVQLSRDKARTMEVLRAGGVTVPDTIPLATLVADPTALRWPVILKPIGGSRSVGIITMASPECLAAVAAGLSGYIAQERWSGEEYTVNMYFDGNGRMQCAVPHLRQEVRAGEVSKGITKRHPRLLAIAERLGDLLTGARGPLCFQAITRSSDEAAVFELNARFGGGFPLAHRAGAHVPKWLMEERLGIEPTVPATWRENLAMLRYDQAVYVEQ
jgi:carbamoyl-phosphate synthase large subunit